MSKLDLDAIRLPIAPVRPQGPIDLEALRIDPEDCRNWGRDDEPDVPYENEAPVEDDAPYDDEP